MSPMRVACCGLALLALGCGGANQPSAGPAPVGAEASSSASRTDPDVITRDDIDRASLGESDALTVVKQLRPRFLAFRGNVSGSDQSGGGKVQVVIDNGRLSGTDLLTTLRGNEIQEIRYLGAAAAAQRFGAIAKAGPVILVRRK